MSSNSLETISIIMIGDTSVGKSTLMKKFISGQYSNALAPTLGVELYKKEVIIEEKKYLYRIWDTCGQERFRSLSQSYYKSAGGIMLLFSLNSLESFENLNSWVNSIKDNGIKDIPITLIGTKCDLDIIVSDEMIQNFVKENNNIIEKYFKCSSKENIGIEEPFIELAQCIIQLNKDNNKGDKRYEKVKIIKNKKNGKISKRKCC